jgi:predicted esterase
MIVRHVFLLLFIAVPAFAQADRYELGRRVHEFEVAWDEKAGDAEARKRAVPRVNQGVQNFLRLNFPAAARLFDEARHALYSADPAPFNVRWAEAIQIVPESRAVDAETDDLVVTLKHFYKVEGDMPKGAVARGKIGAGKVVETAIDKLPTTIRIPIKSAPSPQPSADFPLVIEILVDGKALARKECRVARIEKFASRLAGVKKGASEVPSPPQTIEQATFLLLVKMLEDAAAKKIPETDLPHSRLIFGAERLAKQKEPYYNPTRPGEFWLSIPVEKKTTVIRIRIPPKLETKKSVPILIALHGMGGSENLFFEGYGNGIVPRMAAERGWLVVATRVEGLLGAGPAPNVPAILDELAKRYPIDPKRVYLIGHSMGAGHVVELAQKNPDRYAAVAALGGGGRLSKAESLKGVRFFVGCGKQDFLLESARKLHQGLDEAGVPSTLREYDGIEHMLIVREAAVDVFKFFDR